MKIRGSKPNSNISGLRVHTCVYGLSISEASGVQDGLGCKGLGFQGGLVFRGLGCKGLGV